MVTPPRMAHLRPGLRRPDSLGAFATRIYHVLDAMALANPPGCDVERLRLILNQVLNGLLGLDAWQLDWSHLDVRMGEHTMDLAVPPATYPGLVIARGITHRMIFLAPPIYPAGGIAFYDPILPDGGSMTPGVAILYLPDWARRPAQVPRRH